MAAQASDNFVTRTRFQPLSISSPKTVTNGWISVPETLTGRSTAHQDSAWTSFADNGQHFIVTSHLQSPRPKPNFPSSSPVVVQPVPHNPPTMHVINGFIVGSSPNGNSLHFDPSFRQQQPGLFHAPPPPLQGVAQTVIKNFTPPTDLRASVHRTISDEQFMSSLQQGQRPSSNSLFTIIPAGPPFPENILRPDPRLLITEQLRAFELGRQRNAQLVQFQERKLLQDRLNQLKNTFQPPGIFKSFYSSSVRVMTYQFHFSNMDIAFIFDFCLRSICASHYRCSAHPQSLTVSERALHTITSQYATRCSSKNIRTCDVSSS